MCAGATCLHRSRGQAPEGEKVMESSIGSRMGFGFPAVHGGLERWTQVIGQVTRAIRKASARLEENRRNRETAAELSRLGARELADIGLTRADVDFMDVRNGR